MPDNLDLAERERMSFLLDFSQDIAAVRTKADLEAAISNALQRLLSTRLAMIRVIGEDGETLVPYLWDISLFSRVKGLFDQLTSRRTTITDYFDLFGEVYLDFIQSAFDSDFIPHSYNRVDYSKRGHYEYILIFLKIE